MGRLHLRHVHPRHLHEARWARALEGFLDDELDARQVARVLDHLEKCPGCLAELESLARLQRSLSRLAAVR
ncbi:MAG: zf-HC2 domain-containing protein [Acidimicrobiales bacterium]